MIENKQYLGCPECLKPEDELTIDTIYECENCGVKFSKEETGTHRCEGCGKFASKLTDNGCAECYEDLEELEVWVCSHCEEPHSDIISAWECHSVGANEKLPDEVKQAYETRERAAKVIAEAKAKYLQELIDKYPPKYPIGTVIKNIDLPSSGSFNQQAFVDAEVIRLKEWGGSHGDPFHWEYVLAKLPDKDRQEILSERDIEYQTGQYPKKEYRWCCPWTVVHPGETCSKCGKKFEDISVERRQ